MLNILTLPQEALLKVLPKTSTRSLAKLASAYPRAAGRTFFEVLGQCSSPVTVEFVRNQMNEVGMPSYREIRQAEQEIMKIIHDENLAVPAASATPATPFQQ